MGKNKATIHLNDILSVVALILLGAGCYIGVIAEIKADPYVQKSVAVLLVALLIKTALKR